MQTYIVLLRGINVGGHKRIKMADLRQLLEQAGYSQVTTYIQSGNLVLMTKRKADKVESDVAGLIENEYGFDVLVMVRTPEEWEAAIATNPFPPEKHDPRKLHFTFLDETPAPSMVQELNRYATMEEVCEVRGRVLYVYYPHGAGRSKLSNNFIEAKLGVRGTARNWNTVEKLDQMVKNRA